MRSTLLALSALLVLGLAPLASAQDVIETQSGRTFEGEVLSDDGTAVEIKTNAGATMKVPYEQLTDATQYRLLRKRMGTSAEDNLEIAQWCMDKTMYKEAKRHFKMALDADASMADEINAAVAKARTQASRELLQRAKNLQTEGRTKDARNILSIIVQELPLEPAAEEAAKMLAADTEQRKSTTLVRRRGKEPPTGHDGTVPVRDNGEPFSDDARFLFADVLKAYSAMLDFTHKGLVAGGRSGIKDFEKALKEGDKARKAVDKIRPKGPSDDEIAEAIERSDMRIEEAIVEARLRMADEYLLRNTYNKAGDVIRAGLADYPDNTALRNGMERVTAAASSGEGLGWALGGMRAGGGGRR